MENINEQRRLVPIKITYMNDTWLMVPADDMYQSVTVKGSEDSMIKVLKGLKCADSASAPKSKRNMKYMDMIQSIKMNTFEIFVWSNIYADFSKNNYYIFD